MTQAVEVTDELVAALERLIPQLGKNKSALPRAELISLLASDSTWLLIARAPDANGEIVGALTLVVYRVPTGIRSVVEDAVVDAEFRRRGIAKELLRQAIEFARRAGADNVSLTSNPARVEANRLYQTLGFQRRESNLYHLQLR
ncbi:MAG: GNAT family N-acetyltransferase [Anaerolineales bacterium]|nr:GNAT family N-acetyltransferase [Anaerolineales bacterium]